MPGKSTEFDVGLIVPLSEEFRYVCELLPPKRTIVRDASFYFDLETPAQAPRIVATVLDGMGTVPAAIATERLLTEFAVRDIAMVGIAGALKDDVGLGDVVIANKVDYYQQAAKAVAREAGGIEFALAGNVFQGPPFLLQVARNLQWMPENAETIYEWKSATAARRRDLNLPAEPGKETAEYVVAPIASGDIVGAASEFAQWLRAKRDRTLMAIEMEAAGAAYSAYSRVEGVPMLAVRGISDFADERKAELDKTESSHQKGAWRRYATLNAVDLLLRILTCAATVTSVNSPERPRSRELNGAALEELERLTLARYPTAAAIERLLSHGAIDPRLLDTSGAVAEVAHRAIRAAHDQGRLRDLISAMRRDFPDDQDLESLLAERVPVVRSWQSRDPVRSDSHDRAVTDGTGTLVQASVRSGIALMPAAAGQGAHRADPDSRRPPPAALLSYEHNDRGHRVRND
jgi:nucleoside phosphorylase